MANKSFPNDNVQVYGLQILGLQDYGASLVGGNQYPSYESMPGSGNVIQGQLLGSPSLPGSNREDNFYSVPGAGFLNQPPLHVLGFRDNGYVGPIPYNPYPDDATAGANGVLLYQVYITSGGDPLFPYAGILKMKIT